MTEQMQPGRELDRLVAEVMGYSNIHWTDTEYGLHPFGTEPGGGQGGVMLPFFSEDNKAAMEAWAWLEENHPWKYSGADKATILLGRNIPGKPSVLIMCDYWDGGIPTEAYYSELGNFHIPGNTYPHAISLAVKAAKEARNK